MKYFGNRVRPVSSGEVGDTVDYLRGLTNGLLDCHVPVGSTLRQTTVNDIDLAVTLCDPEEVHPVLELFLGKQNCHYNAGTRIGSYAVPIKGKEELGRVQVDLMFVRHLGWASFIYFSPPEGTSKYKGVVRAILLAAVAASIETTNEMFVFDGETLVARVGWTIDPSRGVKRIYQYRPMRKDGAGYVKRMVNLSCEAMQALYPDHDMSFTLPEGAFISADGDVLINRVQSVIDFLFGPGITESQLQTAEGVIEVIKERCDVPDLVFFIARKRLEGMTLELPPELETYEIDTVR